MENSLIKPCCVVLESLTPKKQPGLSAELRSAIDARNVLTTRTKKRILCDLDEINETSIEKDRKKYRAQAVKEILTSEISYLNQLKLIKDFFMKPIQERAILTTDEFQTLFGNINTIYNVNSELLRELTKDPENIAQGFSKIAPFFKLYSVYAYDYKKSLGILQNAPANNLEFCKFLEMQESRPEVQKKLSALLIAPIQRVPRYRLLLKDVLDHTSPRHSSYSLIIGSLKKVEQAAAHINSLVEEQENTQRLLELQRSLQNSYPSIIKPDRKLIKTGILMKMSQKGSHSYKRYFILMSDILMYCKLKKDNPNLANSLKCSCILPLNKCKVTQILSKGSFKITCQDEVLILHHGHARECEEWVEALQEAIKKYINNRRTLRKDSSSRRPVHGKLLNEYQDVGISPGRPRKKKQPTDRDFEDVLKIIPNDSEDDSDSNSRRNCFGIKTSKRRPIRSNYDCEVYVPVKKLPKLVKESKDCLYPLRNHLQQRNLPETVPNGALDGVQSNNTNQVFVFGSNNQPRRGFNFNLTNALIGLGNSVKRMFGFGEN